MPTELSQKAAPAAPAAPAKKAAVPYYKDFAKASSDIIRKNFSAPGEWKLESKYKGPINSVSLNPTAVVGAKTAVSVDAEFRADCGATVKLNVSPESRLVENLRDGKAPSGYKLTTTYDCSGGRTELVLASKGEGAPLGVELIHQYPALPIAAAGITVATDTKLTREVATLGLSAAFAPHCYGGCEGAYNYKAKECNYTVGVRYCDPTVLKGAELTVAAINKMQNFKTNVIVPLGPLMDAYLLDKCPARDVIKTFRVSFESVCGLRRNNSQLQWSVAVEAPCPALPANTVKAVLNDKKEWNVCYTVANKQSWTAAVSVGRDLKPGVIFTHN